MSYYIIQNIIHDNDAMRFPGSNSHRFDLRVQWVHNLVI
jgi:hypothetical protein